MQTDERQNNRMKILSKDKAISSAILEKTKRQAKKIQILPADESTIVNSNYETVGESLITNLTLKLENKVYNLERFIQLTVANSGSSRDYMLKDLLINSDFKIAFNRLVKFIKTPLSTNLNQQTSEYLSTLIFKCESLVSMCVFGYKQMYKQLKALNLNKFSYQVFEAYALYSFVQSMFKSKQFRQITDNEFNVYFSQLLNTMPQTVIDNIMDTQELPSPSSTLNTPVKTTYEDALQKRISEYNRLYNRPLSNSEQQAFQMFHSVNQPQSTRSNYVDFELLPPPHPPVSPTDENDTIDFDLFSEATNPNRVPPPPPPSLSRPVLFQMLNENSQYPPPPTFKPPPPPSKSIVPQEDLIFDFPPPPPPPPQSLIDSLQAQQQDLETQKQDLKIQERQLKEQEREQKEKEKIEALARTALADSQSLEEVVQMIEDKPTQTKGDKKLLVTAQNTAENSTSNLLAAIQKGTALKKMQKSNPTIVAEVVKQKPQTIEEILQNRMKSIQQATQGNDQRDMEDDDW